MAKQKEVFIAYEPWQSESARRYAQGGATIVCLDFLLERELAKERIPYVSLRDIIDSEADEEGWWLLAQEVAREWYRLPAMQFFQHDGIRIAEALEPIVVEAYLARLLYFVRIYSALKKMYPDAHFSIPARVIPDTPADDCLISFERRAVIDAARVAHLSHDVFRTLVAPHRHAPPLVAWKSLFVRAYNVFIRLVPHRTLKIYASEYWSHIGPVIERMSDIELVLMDSGELAHIPWRQLLKHRIRFRHPSDAIGREQLDKEVHAAGRFKEQWSAAKEEVTRYLTSARGDLDWSPVLEAFEYLINYAPQVIADIGAVHRILEEERPDVVLQLASVGGRWHYFFIMAHTAKALGIPSLELQHASAYIDPRVVYSRIETDYLATFGAYTNSWHERIGHARDQLISVGSTRFDQYESERARERAKGKRLLAEHGLDPTRPVLLAAVPFSTENSFHLDSYQLAEFLKAVCAVQSIVPGTQILFKCRNYKFVDITRGYLKALGRLDCAVAGSEDIFALLCASTAAVCGRSTIIYQAMLAKVPLALYPWKAYDSYNAEVYAPAAPLARTEEELSHILTRMCTDAAYRDELLSRGQHFLEQYSFDGRASERIVETIKRLAKTRHAYTND